MLQEQKLVQQEHIRRESLEESIGQPDVLESGASEDDEVDDGDSESEYRLTKKTKKDDIIMVPIHRKNWIKSVAMVSDKTVTSSRVALSISSAVFMPEVGGQWLEKRESWCVWRSIVVQNFFSCIVDTIFMSM